MSEKLSTLKASKSEIEARKYHDIFGGYAIQPEMPRRSANTCTKEQANHYWEMPPKKIWAFIQETYPDIAQRIVHRIERSKEIAKRQREMNRFDRNMQTINMEQNDESTVDYENIEDFEFNDDDINDDTGDIETDRYTE